MLTWLKNLFSSEPYQGSSPEFIAIQQEIKDNLANGIDLSVIFKMNHRLIHKIKTQGDANIARDIQNMIKVIVDEEALEIEQIKSRLKRKQNEFKN